MATTTPEIVLPPLALKAAGDSESQREVNLAKVVRSPGFPTLVLLLADTVGKWADRVILDFTAHHVGVKQQVDGIWVDLPPMDRPTGDFMLATLKQLCNLDFRERETRQESTFTGQLDAFKYKFHVRCQPVPTGERVQIRVDLPRPQPAQLVEMGMREKAYERVKQMLKQGKGLLVSAALPGDGASMSWKGVRAAGDRFTADFVTFEQKGAVEDEVINVGSVVYDSLDVFDDRFRELLLKEPDTVFFSQVRSPEIMRRIVDKGLSSNRLMVVQIDARSAMEAVFRLQILGMTRDEIQKHLVGVVAHKTLRRLCIKCREAFEPDPSVLAKLGIQPGRVRQFYKQFDPAAYTTLDKKGNPIPPPTCPTCGGTGFFARVGLFEVLENDATLKSILQSQKKFSEATQMWRAAGNPTFREEGLAMLALGITSIEELQRVLKS
ncbi:MAG: Flp pilus assembly complex ATPase component TadA [Planctomycetaceae bacterium]|jgi:type II secretory ATPase GspE/PulE/Tfp pilus assembly ATPase PilB-like protein|nr:Flp pilus assembly complex ATPase component TadA [Planctomycetaceae bacterium]